MKFGSHSYIFTDRWSDETVDMLETARELGLECFDIAVGDDVIFTPVLTRRKAEMLGIDLAISPGGAWPLEYDLSSPDAAQRQAGLAWHKKQVDLAAEMGAVAYTGSLYGHTGVVRRHPPLPEENQHIAEGLHQLAEYGQARNIAIVIEPMSHFRTHLVNRPEQALHLHRAGRAREPGRTARHLSYGG